MDFEDLALVLMIQIVLIGIVGYFSTLTFGACGTAILSSGIFGWYFRERKQRGQ